MRRHETERVVIWVNYVTAGVTSGKKLVFTIEQVTQLLHSFPRNSVAVVMLPNRASDLRSSPKCFGTASYFFGFATVSSTMFNMIIYVFLLLKPFEGSLQYMFGIMRLVSNQGKKMRRRKRKMAMGMEMSRSKKD